MPEVAGRADGLARELRELRARIAPTQEVETIAAGLGARTEALDQKRRESVELLAGEPMLAELGEREREWTRQGEELASWRRTLTRRAASLEQELAQVKATEATWVATLESASTGDTPAELLDAIRQSIAEIKEVRKATSKRRSEVLALQNRIAQQELLVAETLEAVRSARVALRNRLFQPDSPPIWSDFAAEGSAVGESIATAMRSSYAEIRAFLEQRQGRLVALAMAFALAWLGAVGLKQSIAARRAAGAEIEASAQLFANPLSLAALIALLCTFWLLPLAPEALFDVVGLLLVVPIFRLLSSLLHPGFRPILCGIALFYLLDRLRDVLDGAPREARLLFALECVMAALYCVALLRPARLAKIPDPERFPRWPGRVVRFGVAAFGTAFLANVFGFFSLSKLVGGGLLESLYVAIGLYAGVRVLGIMLDVTTETAWAQRLYFLRARRAIAVEWIRRAISAGAIALWVYLSLGALAIQDGAIRVVRALLTASLTLGTVSISLGDLVAFGLTIAAAVVISRVVQFVLLEDLFPRIRTARGVPHAVIATTHYAIVFGGFLLALAAAGIDFTRFALLAGAFGVGIGFGLQSVVSNFVSGLILLYERPIQVGDIIDMGDLLGQVKRIGIRSSTVRTFAGAEVIVPNADLISQRVVNWTLSDKTRRIDIPIGVKYGTDPEQVIQILQSIAQGNERILQRPPPSALFRRHGESSLDFELRVWIGNIDDWLNVESELNTAINRALAAAGIEIPFPQRDLHLRSVDRDAARALAREANAK
ncbi:MAG TPA: mechanosensitive ion channel domain-containing protein [Myxococcota bacterium]|nr:mechanosensitive ion channel domain-containing protein [Myxococcota bacterium]